jgi:hypothetical protein
VDFAEEILQNEVNLISMCYLRQQGGRCASREMEMGSIDVSRGVVTFRV